MKKGFTLVELLAVIVILAIIALIIVPKAINIVKDARKSSKNVSVEMYKKAVKTALVAYQLEGEEGLFTSCDIVASGNLTCEGIAEEIIVEADGEKPTSGSVVFDKEKIISWSLQGNGYDYNWVDEKYAFTGTIKNGEQAGQSQIVSTTPINLSGYKLTDEYCEITFNQTTYSTDPVKISSYSDFSNYITVDKNVCENSLPSILSSTWGSWYVADSCEATEYNGYMGCVSGVVGTYKYVYEPYGLYADNSGNGTSYYFVGDVENKYIKFGGQYNYEYGEKRWQNYGFSSYDSCYNNYIQENRDNIINNGGCSFMYYNSDIYNYVWFSKYSGEQYDYETDSYVDVTVTVDDAECTAYARDYAEYNCKDTSYTQEEDMIWKIVRINEDNSIRIMLNKPITRSHYNGEVYSNTSIESPKYVGYMYGTDSDPYSNKYDSVVKTVLDNFYENYLLSHKKYIGDSGFCNDRTINTNYDTSGYSSKTIIFGTATGFECPNAKRDLFTVSNSKGNQKLKYPIGLLTKKEAEIALGEYSYDSYTMTPGSFYDTFNSGHEIAAVEPDGFGSMGVSNVHDIYPVINLKSTVRYKSGTGTIEDPYIIE